MSLRSNECYSIHSNYRCHSEVLGTEESPVLTLSFCRRDPLALPQDNRKSRMKQSAEIIASLEASKVANTKRLEQSESPRLEARVSNGAYSRLRKPPV